MSSFSIIDIAKKNIESMCMSGTEGYDVIILCCGTSLQSSYWQKKLDDGKGSCLPLNSLVFAVEEDWPGGAGNGNFNKYYNYNYLLKHINHYYYSTRYIICL